MRKVLLLLIVVIVAMGMAGCGKKSPMQSFMSAEVSGAANSDESVIVFFTPATNLGVHIPIVETDENGNMNLVTILVAGTKYLHRTTPGRHLYFLSTVRGRSEMLEANVEAGKIYYTYVSQHPGSRSGDPQYFNAFQFVPVSSSTDASFKEDLALCRWYQNTRAASDWFERNLPDLRRRAAEAHTRHQEADSKKVLEPEYGRTAPVQ